MPESVLGSKSCESVRSNKITLEQYHQDSNSESGVDVPLERINSDTLRKMVEEFVTRDWSDLTDADCTFEDKVEQVFQGFKEKRIKVVFDLTSETCNIVPNTCHSESDDGTL